MHKIVSFFGPRNEIFDALNQKAKDYALERGFEYEWVPQNPFSRKDVITHLQNADVGIIDVEPYGEETFSQIRNTIKLLVRFGVGYDKVDLKAASKHGIAVARTVGANTMGVAEMAITLMLTLRRQLNENQRIASSDRWENRTVCNETMGGTIGIVGFGAIGQAVAHLISGFNCRVIAYDPFPDEAAAKRAHVELVDIRSLFRTADAVTIHVPYSPATHMMVNADLLSCMKPSAVLVNTARGNIVDEDALYHALANKRLRGAALDVFSEEPLPLSSPLFELDNIILTPHVSSQTAESLWRIYAMAIDIAVDFYAGKNIKSILNQDYNNRKESKD